MKNILNDCYLVFCPLKQKKRLNGGGGYQGNGFRWKINDKSEAYGIKETRFYSNK